MDCSLEKSSYNNNLSLVTAKKAIKEKLIVFCVFHKIFYFNNISIAKRIIMSREGFRSFLN